MVALGFQLESQIHTNNRGAHTYAYPYEGGGAEAKWCHLIIDILEHCTLCDSMESMVLGHRILTIESCKMVLAHPRSLQEVQCFLNWVSTSDRQK